MKDWKKTLIRSSTPILEAIKIIDAGALQIALVTDEQGRLAGIVTDGDVRRALLRKVSLEEPVETVMNRDFTTVGPGATRDEVLLLMKQKDLRQIPVVTVEGTIVDLKVLNNLIALPKKNHWVIIMAGGTGTRLQPLTQDCPKPLLLVGERPLIETILGNFIDFGFRTFYLSVNYKAEMIENHLGDGSRWGVRIHYLRERHKLGTAGPLSLLPGEPSSSFIVMNGDVLTKINFDHLLDFHRASKAKATMCVTDYHLQCPYGIVRTDEATRLEGIDEKPMQRFFVNAGIYVFEPEVLRLIPRDTSFDMPALFNRLKAEKLDTFVFPIREYWMDIGRPEDLERANGAYGEMFPKNK